MAFEKKIMLAKNFQPIFFGSFLSLSYAQVCVTIKPLLVLGSEIEAFKKFSKLSRTVAKKDEKTKTKREITDTGAIKIRHVFEPHTQLFAE